MAHIQICLILFTSTEVSLFHSSSWSKVLLKKLRVSQLVEKFPTFFWYPKVHSLLSHKGLLILLILSQMKPVRTVPPYFSKFHFNIILPSTPIFFRLSLSFKVHNQHAISISFPTQAYQIPNFIYHFRGS